MKHHHEHAVSYRAGLIFGACLAAALLTGQARASGDESEPAKPNCPKGQVWDAKTGKCVLQTSNATSDADRTDYAYRLAKDGRYEEALALLDTLQNPNTAKALNYRGYATRKLGRTDEGISYYLKSVALDPNYAQVREYLGEAYVIKGRVDLAQEQLVKIKALCGTTCEEYEDLSEAIAAAPQA
ncbi:tetratricopeptide repeat protein [Pseudomonas costantinii]|uniref:TPR repeat-containing protein n=1 Tax=Pseudomonas costantinii TaxID=168469 RepID=A0A1H5HY02_9PSED|nr:tetratricopeptide repeat protein [Pseudomonas costantinii]NVZ19456.1 tetratricopeptide repeat protein [Pseudomonas costantinii]SEE32805.1 TPR repeat-containing protein [Pseudomonas costantinii]